MDPNPNAPAGGRRRLRSWLGRWRTWVPAMALVGLGGAHLLSRVPITAAATARAKKGAPAQAPALPVVAAEARRGDIDVWLTGLGAVTPLETVTVRTRVDGQLMQVGFEEGQLVRKGQLLAQLDPRPFQAQLALAEGQLARDQALLANARLDLQRYEALAKEDSISRQQYDTQRSLVRQLEGSVESDRGNVANARLLLAYSRITSPIDGRAGLRLVDPGNIVHATDASGLVVLTRMQPMGVVFSIAEDSLPQVLAGLRAGERLRVDAFNRELTRQLASGYLLTVDNAIDPATGTVRLKAWFENRDDALFPNQFVNARLLLQVERDRTLVPAAALQRGAERPFVYVVKPDDTVGVREVKTGTAEGGQVAIEAGLSPGERVVVDGADRLREGSRVVPRAQGGSGAPDGGSP